jgi:hypothetical protein
MLRKVHIRRSTRHLLPSLHSSLIILQCHVTPGLFVCGPNLLDTSLLALHISGHNISMIDIVFIPSFIVLSIPPLSTLLIFSHSHCLSL